MTASAELGQSIGPNVIVCEYSLSLAVTAQFIRPRQKWQKWLKYFFVGVGELGKGKKGEEIFIPAMRFFISFPSVKKEAEIDEIPVRFDGLKRREHFVLTNLQAEKTKPNGTLIYRS